MVSMRIDPHVHFRDAGQEYKETIAHGLALAREEGVDIVFDMPNTQKPILTREDARQRLTLVPEKEKGRYYLYIGATADAAQLAEAVTATQEIPEVIAIKMFAGKSTGNLAIIEEEKQQFVYKTLASLNYTGILAVHCEKEALMRENEFDPKRPITHATSRPNEAEVESIKDQIKFAKAAGFKGGLHICHVSTMGSVDAVNAARKEEKIKITCGATPRHLLWSDEKLRNEHGLLYKMNPPLRSSDDVAFLRKYLRSGLIDWIETDHAPHSIGEKLHKGYPSGYPSLYLYKKFVEETLPDWGLEQAEIERLTFCNIKKAFGDKLAGK